MLLQAIGIRNSSYKFSHIISSNREARGLSIFCISSDFIAMLVLKADTCVGGLSSYHWCYYDHYQKLVTKWASFAWSFAYDLTIRNCFNFYQNIYS